MTLRGLQHNFDTRLLEFPGPSKKTLPRSCLRLKNDDVHSVNESDLWLASTQ